MPSSVSQQSQGQFFGSPNSITVAQATKVYEAHTPPKVQAKLDLAEVDAWVLWHFIDNEVVDDNIGSWIPDLGTYRAQATL